MVSELNDPSELGNSRDLPKITKISIDNDYLIKVQRIFVLTLNIVSLLGCIIAFIQVWLWGISYLEIGLLLGMYALIFSGITVGYHRLFAHTSYKTNTTIRVILAILGSMAGQGPPIYWVANHRRHHQYSDLPEDPHSPHLNSKGNLGLVSGLWYAHIGWLFDPEITNSLFFAKDLLRDPAIAKVNRLYLIWLLLGLAIPGILAGLLTHSWTGAISGFLWGGLVRLFLSLHLTYSINSIGHVFGSRLFNTHEYSRNNALLAIPTMGESWHNNHHAFPQSARFGLKWWQIDLGYLVIRTLEITGLAWDVKVPTSSLIQAKINAN
ncbi:MAG: acyl-CoA desaturase [Nostoc sp.]|uniref:acyl-CoA desaturase n=1 Tax=Nostoc sp. TaxID=1180 RepID=UPI002FF18123